MWAMPVIMRLIMTIIIIIIMQRNCFYYLLFSNIPLFNVVKSRGKVMEDSFVDANLLLYLL